MTFDDLLLGMAIGVSPAQIYVIGMLPSWI